jgi:hypothetical protein
MGDSNLHLNIPVRRYDPAVEKALEPWVYEWIQKRNGSISAEHGLGIAKKKYIGYSRDDTTIGVMKQIKNLFDPVSFTPILSCFLSRFRARFLSHVCVFSPTLPVTLFFSPLCCISSELRADI